MKHELRSDSLEWDWLNPSCTSVCCGISDTIVAGIKGAGTLRLLIDKQTHVLVGQIVYHKFNVEHGKGPKHQNQAKNTKPEVLGSHLYFRCKPEDHTCWLLEK